jgi:hypothetical protein
VAALFAVTFSIMTSGVAHADPYDCSERIFALTSYRTVCTNGTGIQRAVVYCDNRWPGKDHTRNGNWARVAYPSVAFCDSDDRAKGGTMEVGAG